MAIHTVTCSRSYNRKGNMMSLHVPLGDDSINRVPRDKIVYCMWCGHVLNKGDIYLYCTNNQCPKYAVVVVMAFWEKPRTRDLLIT